MSTMKDTNLPGLSPLWLISLSLVLGTVIVVFLPFAINGGDAVKASDWIGFAGNVLAGAFTLIAAGAAWFAVQRQILAQQRMADGQVAIERLIIMQQRVSSIQADERLFWDAKSIAMVLPKMAEVYFSNATTTASNCDGAMAELSHVREKLEKKAAEIDVGNANVAGLLIGLLERAKAKVAIAELNSAMIDAIREAHDAKVIAQKMGVVASPKWATIADTSNVQRLCDVYIGIANTEVYRLAKLIQANAATIGI